MRTPAAEIGMKIGANCLEGNALRGMRAGARIATSRQAVEGKRVAANRRDGDLPRTHDFSRAGEVNSSAGNDMPASPWRAAISQSRNEWAANSLQGFSAHPDGENARRTGEKLTRSATLMRWLKFNLVGAVGIFVQFGVLFLLKSVLHFNYLAATALAVEAAVVHNFFWHERYTWADRVRPSWKKSLPRFLRFNLTTGLLSIAGNLAMMRVMVGSIHMNYLAANGIAIVVCSLLNFLVSDGWVFGEGKISSPRINAESRGLKD